MLELTNISKTFNPGTVNEKTAISHLNFKLEDGDFVTIVGSNGAGKSTLFNAIAGSFYVDEGSIYLDGKNFTYLPEYKRAKVIGRLFQDPLKGTAPHMTIEENLSLAYLRTAKRGFAAFSTVSKQEKEMFRAHLALLGMHLEDRMKHPVGLLSGGQRQALTLLMATIVALDPGTAEKVLELTRSIVSERKISCMMVTHNMHQALDLGNRTLMMSDGSIVLDLKGEERKGLTVEDLLRKFRQKANKALDNDRILLSSLETE